ncbi:MAG: ferrous iron transport protein A [Planctomycetota bacterium]|nr:ferrous iron transport protein A [Planctomycetota bacterium]
MNVPVPLPSGARVLDPADTGPTLAELRPGERCTVRSVSGAGTLRRRLLEMGFVSGTPLRVVRLAPLGDPMEVELHGYHLSLRRAEAGTVLVHRSD